MVISGQFYVDPESLNLKVERGHTVLRTVNHPSLDTMYWFSYAKSFKETCIEPLMYVFDEFIIFAIPSELPRLVNSHWLLDGTFKQTNSLNNFKQTYIISL